MNPPVARDIAEWHDDMGPKLWWRFPVVEPPYCGTPGDSEWVDDYYTHFTDIEVPLHPGWANLLGLTE